MPGLVILFDRILFGVRSGIQQILGVTCSAGGAVVIVFKGDWASAMELEFGRGEGFVIMAIVSWALYTVLLRLKPAISPVSMLACTFLVGVVALAPLAAWEAHAGDAIRWSGSLGMALLYISLFASLIAFLFYNQAAAAIGPVRAGQALNLLPLFGALLSAGLLGETLHAFHVVGMAMILAGTAAVAIIGSPDGAAGRPNAALEVRS
jgi:drug/metabolite transporter (DMT)-like permease